MPDGRSLLYLELQRTRGHPDSPRFRPEQFEASDLVREATIDYTNPALKLEENLAAMRILTVLGTRPEAIKLSPVVNLLKQTAGVDSVVCSTGQHVQMLDQVKDLFTTTFEYDLNVMNAANGLEEITSKIIMGVSNVVKDYRPDLVLVHGDTATTFGAALACYYNKVPVGHVEAGLRTGNIYSPWPEEMNRRLTGQIASLHFAPTQRAAEMLLREGIDPAHILVTGNTVIDALLTARDRLNADPALLSDFAQRFSFLDPNRHMVLVTGHRRENFGEGFQHICDALVEIAARPDTQVVFPIHMNPAVRGPVTARLAKIGNIHLLDPQDYLPFLYLLQRAHLVLTDSGGIQEEAPSFGKPVLVMRDTTERPEAVEAGTVVLVGTHAQTIVSHANRLLDSPQAYEAMARAHNPYGDGHAAARIVERILNVPAR